MDTVIFATRAYADEDTNERADACGSCGQCSTKHTATFGNTAASNSVDDANHADAL